MAKLKALSVQGNSLQGALAFPGSPMLSRLQLNDNQFKGSIPHEICQKTLLNVLNFGINPGLEGTLPSCIKNLTELVSLFIEGTGLSGALSEDLCQLQRLQNLFLSGNALTGTLPACLLAARELQSLQNLTLAFNQLTGSLPETFPHGMKVLDVRHNQISGTVPEMLGERVDGLETLRLEFNRLSCDLPDAIAHFDEKGADIGVMNGNLFTCWDSYGYTFSSAGMSPVGLMDPAVDQGAVNSWCGNSQLVQPSFEAAVGIVIAVSALLYAWHLHAHATWRGRRVAAAWLWWMDSRSWWICGEVMWGIRTSLTAGLAIVITIVLLLPFYHFAQSSQYDCQFTFTDTLALKKPSTVANTFLLLFIATTFYVVEMLPRRLSFQMLRTFFEDVVTQNPSWLSLDALEDDPTDGDPTDGDPTDEICAEREDEQGFVTSLQGLVQRCRLGISDLYEQCISRMTTTTNKSHEDLTEPLVENHALEDDPTDGDPTDGDPTDEICAEREDEQGFVTSLRGLVQRCRLGISDLYEKCISRMTTTTNKSDQDKQGEHGIMKYVPPEYRTIVRLAMDRTIQTAWSVWALILLGAMLLLAFIPNVLYALLDMNSEHTNGCWGGVQLDALEHSDLKIGLPTILAIIKMVLINGAVPALTTQIVLALTYASRLSGHIAEGFKFQFKQVLIIALSTTSTVLIPVLARAVTDDRCFALIICKDLPYTRLAYNNLNPFCEFYGNASFTNTSANTCCELLQEADACHACSASKHCDMWNTTTCKIQLNTTNATTMQSEIYGPSVFPSDSLFSGQHLDMDLLSAPAHKNNTMDNTTLPLCSAACSFYDHCMAWKPEVIEYEYERAVPAYDGQDCASTVIQAYTPVMIGILALILLKEGVAFVLPLIFQQRLCKLPNVVLESVFGIPAYDGCPFQFLPKTSKHSNDGNIHQNLGNPCESDSIEVPGSAELQAEEPQSPIEADSVEVSCSAELQAEEPQSPIEPDSVEVSCSAELQAEEPQSPIEGCEEAPPLLESGPVSKDGMAANNLELTLAEITAARQRKLLDVLLIALTFGLATPMVAAVAFCAALVLLLCNVYYFGCLHSAF
eukprot:gene8086-9605_t